MTPVYPTHTCFDDALDFLEALAAQHNPALRRMLLVHGICLHPDDGHRYAHAWVEQDERFAIFAGVLHGVKEYFGAELGEYYAEFQVQEVTKYTLVEALRENNRSGHYGPWLEKYIRLCKENRKEPSNG